MLVRELPRLEHRSEAGIPPVRTHLGFGERDLGSKRCFICGCERGLHDEGCSLRPRQANQVRSPCPRRTFFQNDRTAGSARSLIMRCTCGVALRIRTYPPAAAPITARMRSAAACRVGIRIGIVGWRRRVVVVVVILVWVLWMERRMIRQLALAIKEQLAQAAIL